MGFQDDAWAPIGDCAFDDILAVYFLLLLPIPFVAAGNSFFARPYRHRGIFICNSCHFSEIRQNAAGAGR